MADQDTKAKLRAAVEQYMRPHAASARQKW
jgi:hypothetical protein